MVLYKFYFKRQLRGVKPKNDFSPLFPIYLYTSPNVMEATEDEKNKEKEGYINYDGPDELTNDFIKDKINEAFEQVEVGSYTQTNRETNKMEKKMLNPEKNDDSLESLLQNGYIEYPAIQSVPIRLQLVLNKLNDKISAKSNFTKDELELLKDLDQKLLDVTPKINLMSGGRLNIKKRKLSLIHI